MCVKFVYTPEDDYKNEKQETPYCNTIFNPADFPLFRLADVYLMLAECELNGAQGCNGLEMGRTPPFRPCTFRKIRRFKL